MLHKKRKPSTFTSSSGFAGCKRNATGNNNMLHSKSTYFYRWLANLGAAKRSYNSADGISSSKVGHDFANEFRESSHHCEKSNTASGTARTILTRSRRQTNSYSKITDRPGYVVPVGCSLALLLGLGIILNPAINSTEEVHAATNSDKCMNGEASSTGQCPMELSLTMSGTNGTGAYEEAGATQLEVGKTAYRSYDFKVSATDIDKDGYKLYATAVETKLGETDFTNQLVNADYPDKEKFVPISAAEGVVGENIAAGQWGYAIAGGTDSALPTVDTANSNPGSLTYKAVPTNQTTPIATGTETTTTDSGIPDNPATVPDEYRLIFGAKANEGMASGHYRTQVMLSLVANPKQVVVGLGGITKMSEMTSAHCASLKTPAANAGLKEVPTGQLIDDREGENGTKYWVSKLADGDCWMTQNMAYDGISNTSGNFNKTKKNTLLAPNDVNNPTSYSEKATTGYTLSEDPAMTTVLDEATKTYNGHYLLGNYYTANNDQAISACTFSNNTDWKLPDPSSASATGTHRSFGRLLGTYSVGDNSAGSTTMRKPPFYFLYAGYYDGSFSYVGGNGRYRSTTSSKILYLSSGGAGPSYTGTSTLSGFSARCVVSGD